MKADLTKVPSGKYRYRNDGVLGTRCQFWPIVHTAMLWYTRAMNTDQGDELEFEADEELGDVAAAQAKLKKLRGQLHEAQQKRDEYLSGWQRCKADAINARKDALLQAERAGAREKESFIADLLTVLDSFDMATASDSWFAVAEEWRSGMTRVQNQLLDLLSRHGVERYGKIGDAFDPRLYEAVQEIEDGEASHTVARILRHGYKTSDRVIRPAQVIVRA